MISTDLHIWVVAWQGVRCIDCNHPTHQVRAQEEEAADGGTVGPDELAVATSKVMRWKDVDLGDVRF